VNERSPLTDAVILPAAPNRCDPDPKSARNLEEVPGALHVIRRRFDALAVCAMIAVQISSEPKTSNISLLAELA